MSEMMMERPVSQVHIPVLREEVLNCFRWDRPSTVIDGTLGLGGHSEALLTSYSSMIVYGCEWDAEAATMAQERLASWGSRFHLLRGSYADLPALLSKEGVATVDGVLLDLGFSSWQLDHEQRGFSFQKHGPLDMRMSSSLQETAWDILQHSDIEHLVTIFKTYGEERFAWRIAEVLKQCMQKGLLQNDAFIIAECIRQAIPYRAERIDPATRCFQALRIAVNHELENIECFLSHMGSLVPIGGRIGIIAYHSLEDRLVKNAFRQAVRGCVCPPQVPQCVCGQKPWARLWAKKLVVPSEEEIVANPRSRSARMRVLEKIA